MNETGSLESTPDWTSPAAVRDHADERPGSLRTVEPSYSDNVIIHDVTKLIIISDDASGRLTKTLLITSVNGETHAFQGDSIKRFTRLLRKEAPDLAERIDREADAAGNPRNYEVTLYAPPEV
jgi:hypothetical protein